MKICILSDSHDNIPLLCTAVAHAKEQGAQAVLHCGDIVAAATLAKLEPYDLPVHIIHGNNNGDLYTLSKLFDHPDTLIRYYGQDADIILGKRRIFLVHYPHYARGMAVTGDYDLVCYGHTHEASMEMILNIQGTQTALCNPGTVGGIGGMRATYILGNLANMFFEIIDDF